mmetsp:Transcript_14649/g.12887  ORF Transcript_14649/g.12887 Transcript_14649/m.12887 type:complete len:89 (-) Transcript_14649:186-452(-)
MQQNINFNLYFNEAVSYDSVWTDHVSQAYTYISVGEIFTTYENEGTDGRLLEITVVQDPKYTMTERRFFSLLDLLGHLGGLTGIFYPL